MNSPIFIVGPTASGKSDLAIALAEQLNGEIISVDSMAVYRGLDIGTAKPSAEQRARVPHHLLDVADLTQPFDAAQFVTLAKVAVADISTRGRIPIFSGGTGFYVKAYLEGLGEAPRTDETLRKELAATPLPKLLEELQRTDPETFQRIDQQNTRRVIRAVAVVRLTGRPYSEQRAQWPANADAGEPRVLLFGLLRDSEDLYQRIERRVDDMFSRGLVAETKDLLDRGLENNEMAMQAIGYRQVVEHLRGERGLAETIQLVKTKTRKFAKRQMTWFRGQLAVEWVPMSGSGESALEAVLTRLPQG